LAQINVKEKSFDAIKKNVEIKLVLIDIFGVIIKIWLNGKR
jgi:hypothetical protein